MRLGVSVFTLAAALLVVAPGDAAAQKKSRDRLTKAEIEKSAFKDLTLADAIKALKPQFLETPRGVRSLGGGQINPIVVYVDGVRSTGLEILNILMANEVEEVRYLDPSKSQNEYGINANGGALQIKRIQKTVTEKKPGE